MKKRFRLKKFVFNSFFLLTGINSFNCMASDSTLVSRQTENLQIYHRALAYSDLSTAASALVAFLNAGGSEIYQDSLAVVYYNMNNLNGAYKLASELYGADKNNATALTLLADISGRSGETKISLEWYEKLCALKPTAYNFYQLAGKQYLLERRLECRQSLQKVISDSAEAAKAQVSMEVGNGYFEQVPVLAAAYNMMGVLFYNEKDLAKAKEWYQKALAAAPDFAIAKQNLEALKPAAPARPDAKSSSPPKTKG